MLLPSLLPPIVILSSAGPFVDDDRASIRCAGDVDRDGRADALLGAGDSCWLGTGRVEVRTVARGSTLLHIDPPLDIEDGKTFGFASAIVGDADGDGARDIAVGSPGGCDGRHRGEVLLFSAATGRLLARAQGAREDERLGTALS